MRIAARLIHMPETPDPSSTALDVHACPRCHRNKLVRLKSMRRYDSREWFKCDGCEHLFTIPPVIEAPETPAAP
jgi:hypothetical protein